MYAYAGSRTTRERHARGEGLSVLQVDAHNGALTRLQVVGDLVNPSYLALSHDGTRLYTVHGDCSDVSAFRIDPACGSLTPLARQDTQGRNPVHLALSPDGRHLLVTNHLGASVVVLPVQTDGGLGPVAQRVSFDGPLGPHRIEQQQAKPHFNAFDPSGRWVVVPDKGLDRVFVFAWQAGRLSPAAQPFLQAREGAGPRSLAFHPDGRRAYVVNELDSTVTACDFDPATGRLVARQVVSTLPDSCTGHNRAAGIVIDAAGRSIYASNRGHDSLALFRIDPVDGRLQFIETVASGGRTPRFFTLSPDGRLLLALNEDSDTIVSHAVDATTGRLTPTGQVDPCGSPTCLVFLET